MTVSASPVYAELAWTGVETSFAPGILAQDVAAITVKYVDAAGTTYTLSNGVNLTLTKAGAPGIAGTVSAVPLAMPAAPGTVTFERISADTQATPFQDLSSYSATTHEKLHDAAALRDAELRRDVKRAVKAPKNEVGPSIAGLAARQNGGNGGVLFCDPISGDIKVAPPITDSTAQAALYAAEAQAAAAQAASSPVDYSAAHVVANSEKREFAYLSGGYFTHTFNDPVSGGYDSDFYKTCVNLDAGRYKRLDLTAGGVTTKYKLPPRQFARVFRHGNAWTVDPPLPKWIIPNGTQFQLDPGMAAGAEQSNDGLDPSSAFKDPILAYNWIRDNTMGSCSLAWKGGVIYPGFLGEFDGDVSAGYGRIITMLGDPSLVNPPQLLAGVNQNVCIIRDGAWLTWNGFLIGATAAGSTGPVVQQDALADFENIEWGSFVGGYSWLSQDGADVNITGKQILAGEALSWGLITDGAKVQFGGVEINASGVREFTEGFLQFDGLARGNFQGTASWTGSAYTALSKKYSLKNNSHLNLAGNVIPGTVAGTADATSSVKA